jgi:glycosyltransferase involved in cell wall biosynthesis
LTSIRVLLVAPRLHGADGVSFVSRQLVRALDALQHNVQTWVLDDVERQDLIEAATRMPDYRARGRLDLVLHGFISPWRQSFDRVVVTHLHLLPVVAGHLARHTKLAVYLHGIECWRPLGALREALLSRADVLLANSSYTAERFAIANPRFVDRAVHICPPAAPDDIQSSAVPSAPTVLVVGRISKDERYKGHDTLLDVWPSIMSAIPGARLVFVGDGDDRSRLECRIRDEGLATSAQIMGLVSRADLREAYASCRVFAMPSGEEGFGIVFLEAMLAGRPCIGAYGAAAGVIDPGRTGLLVSPRDAPALEAALLRLLTDSNLCREMGNAGRLRAKAHFSETSLADKLYRALNAEPVSAPV